MTIEVEMSDGSIAEFPDGTPHAVMQNAARQYHQKTWQPTQRSPADIRAMAKPQDPTEGMGFGQKAAAGFGKSFVDTGQGIGQLFGAVSPEDVDRRRAIDAPLMDTGGGMVGNAAGVATQILMPATDAAKLVSYAGKGAGMLKGAAQGAAFSAAQPVASDESRAGNTAMGAGLGAAGAKVAPMLANAGSRAANAIRPEIRAAYEAAKARGISLTPAQLSDSRFMKYLNSQMQSLPFSGSARKAAEQRGIFNKRLAESIGSDAPVVTPEVYAQVKATQSAKFEELTGRNDLRVTPQLISKLEAAIKDAELAGGDALAATRAAVDDFYGRATTGAGGIHVPGKAYQALDSSLGQVTKNGTPASHYVGQVKHAIREAMDKSISKADKQAWSQLRTEYGNRKTLRDLVAKGDGGMLSPTQLMGRVTKDNWGKEAMASGTRGEMGELARIGQVMKEPPDSGTASRQLANSILLPWNAVAQAGRSIGGAAAGRVLNSETLAALMMRQGRGNTLSGLARLVDKSQPQKLLPGAGVLLHNQADPEDIGRVGW